MDPRPNSPEDVGFVHAPAPRKRPRTDREVLESLPKKAFEGCERVSDPDAYRVTLRKASGKRCWFFHDTEAGALGLARMFVDVQGLEE